MPWISAQALLAASDIEFFPKAAFFLTTSNTATGQDLLFNARPFDKNIALHATREFRAG
jgi:hypothetical protein